MSAYTYTLSYWTQVPVVVRSPWWQFWREAYIDQKWQRKVFALPQDEAELLEVDGPTLRLFCRVQQPILHLQMERGMVANPYIKTGGGGE